MQTRFSICIFCPFENFEQSISFLPTLFSNKNASNSSLKQILKNNGSSTCKSFRT